MKLTEKDVTTFGKWWKVNKAVYEKAGVDEDVACSIWVASSESMADALRKAEHHLSPNLKREY